MQNGFKQQQHGDVPEMEPWSTSGHQGTTGTVVRMAESDALWLECDCTSVHDPRGAADRMRDSFDGADKTESPQQVHHAPQTEPKFARP